jgi:hypothetical protein
MQPYWQRAHLATVPAPLLLKETPMKPLLPDQQHARVDREVARERQERSLNDDARTGLAPDDEFRAKDARESMNSSNLRRSR